jgi:ferredoxin-NADP reductase
MDAADGHRVRVVEVIPRGARAVSARFERPPGFTYSAGQWALATIGKDGEALTRHLTLSSSPTEPFLEMTKGMTGHSFAEAFRALVPGDEVTLRPPQGRFMLRDGDEDVVFVSGGIGITPLRSMARYAADTRLLTRILLLYSARTADDLVFADQFEELQRANPLFSFRVTLTRPDPGWTGQTGRMDRAFLEREVADFRGRAFYVSGPSAMVDAIAGALAAMGVPADKVRREVFTGY